MRPRSKPFPYDAIETKDSICLVFPSQGGSTDPAAKTITQVGLQIDRTDGVMIRMMNLHPRVHQVIEAKPVFAIEVADDTAVLYSVGNHIDAAASIDDILADQFYWYIGPETSTIEEAGNRPLAKLFSNILRRPIKIAPGETGNGPCIGLCQSSGKIVTLALGRRWAQASAGVIIDAGLAAGTTTGYPANDNIPASVVAAHSEQLITPKFRRRSAWSSQIGCAFLQTSESGSA